MTLLDLGFKKSSMDNIWKGIYISQGPSKKKSHTQKGITVEFNEGNTCRAWVGLRQPERDSG